MSFNYKYSQT